MLDEENDIESIFSQADKINLKLACTGITSAKMLADIKRYGCLIGSGSHLYPEMTRSAYEDMMQYSRA